MEGFDDLLHDARKLTAEIDVGANVPHVERNLNQILESAQRLAAKASVQVPENAEVKASLLLGSRGYDVQQMSQKLEAISSLPTYETLEPIHDTDVQSFLRNERENMLLSIMEQTKKRTFDEVEKRHWASISAEWERDKQKILSALVSAGSSDVAFAREPETSFGPTASGYGLNSEERAFALELYKYNEEVLLSSSKRDLLSMFVQVSSMQGNQNVAELWKVVSHMSDIRLPFEKAKAEKLRAKPDVVAQIITGATKYLSESFLQFMKTAVFAQPEAAKLGGKPGTYSIVESYLRVIVNNLAPGYENTHVEPMCPIWPFIYFCVRCGDLQAAWKAISKVGQSLENFPQFFREYMQSGDRRLSAMSERDLRLQYRSTVRNSTDLYKKAVYCILGHCDLHNDHSEVAEKIDDYLWLKLQQVHIGDVADISGQQQQEQMSLTQLQTLLRVDFGETHFRAYEQPFLYFRVLYLTGQFEAAVEFLARLDQLRCHAVHIAIALYEQGLLLVSPNAASAALSRDHSDVDGIYRLNLARIVITYCRRFENAAPLDALNYYFCLRHIDTSEGDNCFMTCLRDVVTKTGDFELLFLPLTAETSRQNPEQVNALLEKLLVDALHEQPTAQRVIAIAEKYWEQCGTSQSSFAGGDDITSDDRALKPEKVVEVVARLLAQVVVQPPQAQSKRERVGQLAVAVAEKYQAWNLPRSHSSVATLHLLIDFMTVFDSYHSGKYEDVINMLKDLGILPFTMDVLESKVSYFQELANEIRRCIPDVLLLTVGTLLALFKKNKVIAGHVSQVSRSPAPLKRANDGGLQAYLDSLRSQARAIITYAGMIPYHLPEDTNARLMQMEIQMN